MKKYNINLRILHWTIAVIILALIASGWYMTSLSNTTSYKFELYALHKSFGVLVFLLVCIRLLTRLLTYIPPLPTGIPPLEVKLAHITHFLLYLLMFAVPLSGYIMSDAGGYGVKMFGINMPRITSNQFLAHLSHNIHHYIGYILLSVVIIHVAGVIKHKFFDKKENNVLPRML